MSKKILKKNIDLIKKDHDMQVDLYKYRCEKTSESFKAFFNLKISIIGIITLIFSVLFSNSEFLLTSSSTFKISFLVLFFMGIILITDEVFRDLASKINNQNRDERDSLLTNIRYHSVLLSEKPDDKFDRKFKQASNIYNKDIAIKKDLEEGLSVSDIVQNRVTSISWKFNFFVWFLLIICVPILFFCELFIF